MFLPCLPQTETSWKGLFLELYGRRDMWKEDEEHALMEAIESQEASEDLSEEEIFLRRVKRAKKKNEVTDRFKVNVFARFRPLPESKEDAEEDNKLPAQENSNDSLKVTLPLHQRLSMIRMSGAKSKREALRVLASEGEWFGKSGAISLGKWRPMRPYGWSTKRTRPIPTLQGPLRRKPWLAKFPPKSTAPCMEEDLSASGSARKLQQLPRCKR